MKLPKLKYWYHATDVDTANKIINCGYLVPQNHRKDLTLGVFFANTMANAAQWMSLRGIEDYVVFKIERSRFNPNDMRIGGADRMPAELNMICMRYLNVIKVQAEDGTVYHSPKFEIPGVEIFTQGTGKLGFKVVDLAAFESYVESNPEIKQMINKKLETV